MYEICMYVLTPTFYGSCVYFRLEPSAVREDTFYFRLQNKFYFSHPFKNLSVCQDMADETTYRLLHDIIKYLSKVKSWERFVTHRLMYVKHIYRQQECVEN